MLDIKIPAYQWPVTVDGVEICVANTRILDVDENLIRTGLLDGNLLVLDGAAGLVDDLCPLLGWDGSHCDGMCGEDNKI